MRFAQKFLWASFFLPLLFINAQAWIEDDTTPEVTARVIRISFLRGDVQVRRTGDNRQSQDWEKGTLNLPLVEGDEISTGPDALVEIQLDSSNHIRLSENSYLKVTTLRDDGIAVSLPQGTMSFRSLRFDKSRSFFEIDAPDTTLSIERAGLYRVDAGDTRNSEIRVAATENGEAKVYTKTSGFTLRNRRAARIFVDGNYAGDYETSNVAAIGDGFDDWVLARDAVVAKRLNKANYDQYYDRDMYGAEDLNEYGEWIYTKKYGYVWKPFPNTTAGYSNWSPYRYGHWRWLPFYGWTWVNDEPWGWATYHHGRWVFDSGYWIWSPYGYYRQRRSWWSPGYVNITTWNGSQICWYPLGYDDRYYDYNSYWRRGRDRDRRNNVTIINNNTTVIVNPTRTPNPTASPTPPVLTPEQINEMRSRNARTPTLSRIPASAVVGVNSEEFGKRTRGYQTVSGDTAKKVLQQNDNPNQTPPILPTFDDVKNKVSRDILIENPRIDRKMEDSTKTGATTRETGRSLDRKLETERIYGNRQPKTSPDIIPGREPEQRDKRDTGVVTRQPPIRQPDRDPNQTPDIITPRDDTRRSTGGGKYDGSTRKNDDNDNRTPPIYQTEEPKRETQPTRQPPRETTPRNEDRRTQPTFPSRNEDRKTEEPRREPPRQPPPPRQEEPRREPPRQPPPPKQEQPAPKQEAPRNERKKSDTDN